jgi:hypothetical protein
MMQTELLTNVLSSATGNEITLEVASKKIKSYSETYPTDPTWYFIGREILERIMAQPGCIGIKFYNALYEDGSKNLVYVGIDEAGKTIIELAVNAEGQLTKNKGIIANRAGTSPTTPFGKNGIADDEWWGVD